MKTVQWITKIVLMQFNISLSTVQSFLETFPKTITFSENAAQASLIKVLLLKSVWISRLRVQNVIYWSYYFDNLNLWKKSNKKSWQGYEACPFIKQGCSKRMDNERHTPAKTLIIQFQLHLSTKSDWLADFSRSCTSHLLVTI